MGGAGRWAYMSRPDYNPPTQACPVCVTASRAYYIGGKHVPDEQGGRSEHRWQCEHRHEWVVVERPVTPRAPDPPDPPEEP